ncbi:MAG: TonB-dependent receptor, partial [Proteobacteria bacterium]|nr:TonB-dependent receptor [Pseudomonadota bacterium]
IDDILMNIAGIDVMKSSGVPDSQASIMMRGFDDSRFIVAIDGRPLTGSTGKANTSIDWSALTLGDIEKIEIIRGGASAAYESAEGGVINIITKKGVKRDSPVPRLTYAQDYSANFDYTDAISHSERINVDGGIGGLTYFLNYGHRDDDAFLKNNDFKGEDYSARFTYLFPFQGLLLLSHKGSSSEMGNPVVNWPGFAGYDPDYPKVSEDADTIKYRAISYNYPGRNYRERYVKNLDVAFEQPIQDKKLKIYYYETENYQQFYYFTKTGVPSIYGGNEQTERHFGGGITLSLYPFENNSLTLGYNFKRTEAKELHDIFRIHAGYFEDFWKINDKWDMKTGLRVSKARQQTYPFKFPWEAASTRHLYNDWFVLPKFALTYNIRPETNVYVSVSKDYDVPGC